MVIVRRYIRGQAIKAPTNDRELAIDISFDPEGDGSTPVLTTNEWQFDLEAAKPVLKHYNEGLTGGVGVFEGLDFVTKVIDVRQNFTLEFKQYLDLTDSPDLTRDYARVKAQDRQGINQLSDVSDGFTFQYLYERTVHLNQSKFIDVPYVINSVPNYSDLMLTIVSTSFVISQLNQALNGLGEETARAFTVIDTVGAVLVIIYRVIRIVLLLIALIKLIQDIIDLLIQPVKYHKGMYVRDLFIAGCDHLGLQFTSPIFDNAPFNKLLIMPAKSNLPIDPEDQKERLFGFTNPVNSQVGYYEGTFGDLIRAMKTMFNGKVVIRDGVLWFVRKDHSFRDASFKIPKFRPCNFTINSNEIASNYVVEFQTDVQEKNTIQEYDGTIVRVQTEPITDFDKDLRILKGLRQESIPFALGKRKTELNAIEKIVKAFLDVASGILNALILARNSAAIIVDGVGKIINLLNKIVKFFGVKNPPVKPPKLEKIDNVDFGEILDDRVGMLKLEFDSFNVPKIMLINKANDPRQTKMPSNNADIINAKYLWDNFHIINSFAPYAGNSNGNQWIRHSEANVPFCASDFEKVKNNNSIFDNEGNEAKIERLLWRPYDNLADIEYRVNKKYTNNLKTTIHEPKGN